MNSTGDTRSMAIKRRKYIHATGVSIASMAAGCIGSGSVRNSEYQTNVSAATTIDSVGSDYVTTSIEALADNIETETNGEITVDTYPAGQIGDQETGIMKRVQQGAIQFGDTSLQNFAPVAPSFDIVNLPFFAGTNQEYVNLLFSDAWKEIVETQATESGFEVFSYGFNDPRCWAPAGFANEQPPLTPSEIRRANITQRTGGSPFTNTAFDIIGANPTPINWGESPTAIQQGTANAMYNAPQYHANSGFGDLLSDEVVIDAVHDGRIWAMSHRWFSSLPGHLQDQIKTAGEKTSEHNIKQNETLRKNAVEHMQEHNTDFWIVEGENLEEWKDTIAYDRNDRWSDLMNDVFENEKAKRRLERATEDDAGIDVQELSDVL